MKKEKVLTICNSEQAVGGPHGHLKPVLRVGAWESILEPREPRTACEHSGDSERQHRRELAAPCNYVYHRRGGDTKEPAQVILSEPDSASWGRGEGKSFLCI